MTQNQESWYVRKKGHVTGPFSSAVITNYITIGRLLMSDEISSDEKNWKLIQLVSELHPQLDTDELERAKRLQDERTGRDRRKQQQPTKEQISQRKGERRIRESENELERRALRQLLMDKYLGRTKRFLWPLILIGLGLFAVTFLAVFYPTTLPIPLPNCSTEAGPAINWENCLKPKLMLNNKDLTAAKLRNSQLMSSQMMNVTLKDADMAYADLRFVNLSYSNLTHANLLGANLSHADLSYTDLTSADLSFADLTDVNLGQAKLTGTRFDNAIWINGAQCAVGSIGQCNPIVK